MGLLGSEFDQVTMDSIPGLSVTWYFLAMLNDEGLADPQNTNSTG